MNARERFLATMDFEKPDIVPQWEFGYWAGAVRRWYEEGLPLKVGIPTREEWPDGRAVFHNRMMGNPGSPDDYDIMGELSMDKPTQRVPVTCFLSPPFQEQVLADMGDFYKWSDADGAVKLEDKTRVSMPKWLSWAVSGWEDWERIKAERLDPSLEGRLPRDWESWKQQARNRDYPLLIGDVQGFYGSVRRLLGPENILLAFYDHPDLIREMINCLADFWIKLYDQVLEQIDVDAALVWEDNCYKSGPLISPAMFREFILPAYQKITSLFRSHGIKHIIVDTDGNCWKLIPLFMEGGVTGMFPFEVAAGMNVVEVRKAFPRLQILGGIDKQALARGSEAIQAELECKVPFMLSQGGYIPSVDHTVPPDISWDDFRYYRLLLKKMMGEPVRKG